MRWLLALAPCVFLLLSCTSFKTLDSPVPVETLRALAGSTSQLSEQGQRLLEKYGSRHQALRINNEPKLPGFDGLIFPELQINKNQRKVEGHISNQVVGLRLIDAYAQALLATKISDEPSKYIGTLSTLSNIISKATGIPGLESLVSGLLGSFDGLETHAKIVNSLRSETEVGGVTAHPAQHTAAILSELAKIRFEKSYTDYQDVYAATRVNQGEYTNAQEVVLARVKLNQEINGMHQAFRIYRRMLETSSVYLGTLVSASKAGQNGLNSFGLFRNAVQLIERSNVLSDFLDALEDSQILRGVTNGTG